MLNNFIGGGQVFLHKVRMFSQVFFRTLHVSLFVGILVSCWLNWSSAQRLDWNGFVSYKKATMALGFDDAFAGIRESIGKDPNHITYINASSGGRVYENIDPYKVIRMGLFQRSNKEGMDFLISTSFTAGAISFGCFVVIFLLWSKFGRGLKSEKKKQGSGTVLTASEVKRKLKSLKIASDFTIGDMPLVKDMETRHFLITGSTGSGKTNWMHNILPQIEKKAQPTVVVDQTGEMIAKYYNKERGDIIFNPFDERSHIWDFWTDCSSLMDIENFANILIGFNSRKNHRGARDFWEEGAQSIFVAFASRIKDKKNYPVEKLYNTLCSLENDQLKAILKGTPASKHFSKDNEKVVASIMSVLVSNIKPLRFVSGEDADRRGEFSLKSYFEGVKNGSGAWLFLSTKPKNRSLTLPLIACLVELALAELMDIGINEDRKVWFVLDELAALGVLPGLSPLMTEGRKYGACVIAGLQSLNQLYKHYGQHAGSEIFGQFGTLCFFRNQEESIVRMISNMCGTETITRQSKNTSFGANEFRDGVSYNEQETKKQLVTQNDISSLAVGECYMLFQEPEVRLAKVQTPKSEVPAKNAGFVQGKSLAAEEYPTATTFATDDTLAIENMGTADSMSTAKEKEKKTETKEDSDGIEPEMSIT